MLLRRHFGGPLQKASSASEVSTGTIVSLLFPVSCSWQLPQNTWHCIRAKCSCGLRTPLLTALRGNVAEVGGLFYSPCLKARKLERYLKMAQTCR